MTQSRKWAWISGWGIQPQRFQAAVETVMPDDLHKVFAPEPQAIELALQSQPSHFGSYSLGSLLLLDALDQIPLNTTVVCIAPILAFCKEAEMGGTTPLGSLQLLQAKLDQNPSAALKLFYRLAKLSDEPTDDLPYPIESLAWGLQQLATIRARSTNLKGVEVVIGKQDPLLNADVLCSFFEHPTTIQSQHHYQDLLTGLAARLHP